MMEDVNGLLETAYQLSGVDFREYEATSMRRRIRNHLNEEGLQNVSALRDKIQNDRQALRDLLYALNIDVTTMFRNPRFFSAFRKRVVPLLRDRPFVRIWHAGCASGEEVLSMAILLQEEHLFEKARIYATDISQDALRKARQGIYPIRRMKEYTSNYMASGGQRPFSDYYTAIYDHVIFHPSLQENIVWAQHNLASDDKFQDFDVIICRNVLIYFGPLLKNQVHKLLYNSLLPGGVLGLGLYETNQFTPFESGYISLDKNQRIYLKTGSEINQ